MEKVAAAWASHGIQPDYCAHVKHRKQWCGTREALVAEEPSDEEPYRHKKRANSPNSIPSPPYLSDSFYDYVDIAFKVCFGFRSMDRLGL